MVEYIVDPMECLIPVMESLAAVIFLIGLVGQSHALGHFKRFSRSHSRHTILQNDNYPVLELLRQFLESWSGNLSILGVMISTID